MRPVASLLLSLQIGPTEWIRVVQTDGNADSFSPNGHTGRFGPTTQIYEETNQVQRVVISKALL